ncbi:MAG: hypothetical protein L3K19_07670 [Thermoplasmata archaeon]|nr:hypothetical protein [Thermoplasmata archaeon]
MVETFDAIVVGSDLSAGTVAVALAGARGRVLSVDPDPASTGPGGLLWPAELAALRPEIARDLPAKTRLVEHRWQILNDPGAVSVEYRGASSDGSHSGPRMVLDRDVGRWMLSRAEAAGVERVHGEIQLLESDGRVAGIRLGGEEKRATVTILTEAGMGGASGAPSPSEGLSATYLLGDQAVRNRFAVRAGEGVSIEAVLSFLPPPLRGVGFLHAHGETVTAGAFVLDHGRGASRDAQSSALERFVAHPSIAGFLSGAGREASLTSRRLPSRRGPSPDPPGLLRIGRAAGYDLSSGPILSGPGCSLRSALVAADAVQEDWRSGDPERHAVSVRFAQRMRSSGMPGMLAYQAERSRRVAFRPRLHHQYPIAVQGLLHRLMTETGAPKESVMAAVRGTRADHHVRTTGLLRDLFEAGGSL